MADELLEEYARQHGVSLRELGVLDKRSLRRIKKREITMSAFRHRHREALREDED